MRINKTKNASRNMVYTLIMRSLQMILPFIVRTVVIYYMGIRYAGLNSLFASILQVLNLTELGVGHVMIFSMYKPIAEDDSDTICALMALYRKYYRIIGGVVLAIGLALLPFLPYLVKFDTVPNGINVYILYLMYLGQTVFSYWLFAYRNCLFNAHQRVDILSKVSSIIIVIQYGLQILVVVTLGNYYIYTLIMIVMLIVNNIVVAILSKKMYPQYSPRGKLEKYEIKSINRRVKDLFINKLGSVVVDSADTIVISAFLGLAVLAVYQNYFFVLTSVVGIIGIIFTSLNAGIGNSLVLDSKKKNYKDFEKISFAFMWILGICVAVMFCLYQPFMYVWMGKGFLLPFEMMASFCIYFFVKEIEQLLSLYRNAAGKFHEDRFRTVVSAVVNLALNLILVRQFKLYGILFSTIVSFALIGIPWIIRILFTTVFEKKYWKRYCFKMAVYIVGIAAVSLIAYAACYCIHINKWVDLFLKALICFAITNILFIFMYRKSKLYGDAKILFKNIVKSFVGGLRRKKV